METGLSYSKMVNVLIQVPLKMVNRMAMEFSKPKMEVKFLVIGRMVNRLPLASKQTSMMKFLQPKPLTPWQLQKKQLFKKK